jgi:hypothetical protein
MLSLSMACSSKTIRAHRGEKKKERAVVIVHIHCVVFNIHEEPSTFKDVVDAITCR